MLLFTVWKEEHVDGGRNTITDVTMLGGGTNGGAGLRGSVKKQQLELDMDQKTGSKSEEEYIKDVYCHPAYLTYMQSTS